MTDTVIRMPRLADTLVEGTIARWLKQVGEPIAAGEPLASIETDKVTTELTAPAAGTVLELLAAEGDTVAVDAAIARIGSAHEAKRQQASAHGAADAERRQASAHGVPDAERRQASAHGEPVEPGAEPPRVAAPRPTPVAAKLLAEHGLAAQAVAPDRRVTKADVLRYLERQPSEAGLLPLSSMRKAIAEHMTRAAQTIPHGQTVMLADLTALIAWRDQHKASFEREHGAPLTFTVLFVHALARALASRQRPVDLGVAVALDAGLIVPVIRAADALSLAETARSLHDLATRARGGKLALAETHGALMTVTNVGSFGNLFASPIVPLEQMGILGPGLVERRPMATPDGAIKIGWRCLLTLMFDRRALDDLGADRLLRSVADSLQEAPVVREALSS